MRVAQQDIFTVNKFFELVSRGVAVIGVGKRTSEGLLPIKVTAADGTLMGTIQATETQVLGVPDPSPAISEADPHKDEDHSSEGEGTAAAEVVIAEPSHESGAGVETDAEVHKPAVVQKPIPPKPGTVAALDPVSREAYLKTFGPKRPLLNEKVDTARLSNGNKRPFANQR